MKAISTPNHDQTHGRSLWLAVLLLVVTAAAVLILPAGGADVARATTPLSWPAPGDTVPQATLIWPAPGDTVPQAKLTWPPLGDEVLPALVWPAPGDVPEVAYPVYFCRGGELASVTRPVKLADLCCETAVDLLLTGPTATEQYVGYSSALTAGARVRSIEVEGGVACVDLGGGLVPTHDGQDPSLALGQLVYTLTELPLVEQVELHVDGEAARTLDGLTLVSDTVSREDWEVLTK